MCLMTTCTRCCEVVSVRVLMIGASRRHAVLAFALLSYTCCWHSARCPSPGLLTQLLDSRKRN
eukprot:scaffold53388_cov30-Tisochrysis_lutea.AAC.4